jgi:hypothetical protein
MFFFSETRAAKVAQASSQIWAIHVRRLTRTVIKHTLSFSLTLTPTQHTHPISSSPTSSHSVNTLINIPEIRILAIRQIIEPMRRVRLLAELPILLLIPADKIPAQEQNHQHQQAVAAEVDTERFQVAGLVAVEEDLGARGIAAAPREEIHGDADGFLRLPTNVSREHRHAETLGRPEGEDDPVAYEEAGAG